MTDIFIPKEEDKTVYLSEWEGATCTNCGCDCHCSDTERELDDREISFIKKGECYECSTVQVVCNECRH